MNLEHARQISRPVETERLLDSNGTLYGTDPEQIAEWIEAKLNALDRGAMMCVCDIRAGLLF